MNWGRSALCLTLFLFFTNAFADSSTQSDWSGGPGVWGPVTSFGDDFYSDSGIECHPTAGGVCLDLIDQVWGHEVATGYNGATWVHPVDLDKDGDTDIVGAAWKGDEVTWWENADGSGSTWIEHVIDDYLNMATSACAWDFDGDGDTDVAATSEDDEGGVFWYENLDGSGGDWSKHSVDASYPYANTICLEDIDGDGTVDLLASSMELRQVAWWRRQGEYWSSKHVIVNHRDARSICTGDIDGDGSMDVVGADFLGAAICWWENLEQAGIPGPGISWEEHIVGTGFQRARGVKCADIDSDGDLDIVGVSYADAVPYDVSWWENTDGAGETWTMHIIDGDFFGARSVDAADIDDDGDIDVLGTSWYRHDVTWWENLDGEGTSWRKHLIDDLLGNACSVSLADVDGDGILDAIAAGRQEDVVCWYDIKTYPPEGFVISSVLDVACSPDWGTLDWTADAPSGTQVVFQVRSSASPDSTSMGPWSDTLTMPCSLDGILADGEQYVQYKAILLTEDEDITPSLQSVTLTWDPLGTGGDPAPSGFEMLPISPNPASGCLQAVFCLPEPSEVELVVLDISGRMVQTCSLADCASGWHEIQLDAPGPGIYFVRIRVGEFKAIQRFVVIE